jgi:hypothetical protein
MKEILVALLFVSIALADPPVNMPVSVAAGGAVHAVNANGSRVRGTVGQSLARRVLHVSGIAHSGFWPSRHASAPLSVDRTGVELPQAIEFGAAYPNPFNPSTKLSFSLPNTARVKLSLFDVTGRNLATLADEVFSSGNVQRNLECRIFCQRNVFRSARDFWIYSHTKIGFAEINELFASSRLDCSGADSVQEWTGR